MGLREQPKREGPYANKPMVFGILARGGNVRTIVASKATAKVLKPLIREWADTGKTRLITDGHNAYKSVDKEMKHESVDHEVTYVVDDVHTQNNDGYWSLLKRGLYGTYHHVEEGYLPSYLNEFEFRYNSRKAKDVARFGLLKTRLQGRLLWYCQTPQPENPHA